MISGTFNSTAQMPVLFVGHGSPMNAIEENEFVQGWREIGKTLPKPRAILCVSAHWETMIAMVRKVKVFISFIILKEYKRKAKKFIFYSPTFNR